MWGQGVRVRVVLRQFRQKKNDDEEEEECKQKNNNQCYDSAVNNNVGENNK